MSVEEAPFVPTVTAISSTPDFQWMVQPTIITSVSPSLGSKQANEPQSSQQATPKEGGNKGKYAVKKGKAEQVGWSASALPEHRRSSSSSSSLRCSFRCLCFPASALWCRAPSIGSQFIFRSQPVCNNGLFLEALQAKMRLPLFKGCAADGLSRLEADETAGFSGAITELFVSPSSCLQRRKRKKGSGGRGIKWPQLSVATGGGSSQTRCKL